MQALETLYRNPDKAAKDQANAWLQDFQKTPEAWQTANSLLLAQDLPLEPRLFAAQTFRTKTTFDLDQVPSSSRGSLRDTLVTALAAYASGPRVIQTQICLTLAGLAIQLTDEEWPDVVKGMTSKFGNDASTVGVLLEFLTVLPEEVTGNHRIPVEVSQEWDQEKPRLRRWLTTNVNLSH
jgi:transportin-3